MAKEKVDLKEKLRHLRFDMDFLQRIDCSKEDNKKYCDILKSGNALPEGVFQYKNPETGEPFGEFYTVYDSGLSDSEKQEYIQYQSLLHIKTIKNCVIFFMGLTVVSLFATILILLH